MFDFKFKKSAQTAVCLTDTSYSIISMSSDNKLLFEVSRSFSPKSTTTIAESLIADARQFNLIGQSCKLVLPPSQYQLLMMDALDVPEKDMAKALKWRLKGLMDYPLNDIVVDAFLVPPHGVAQQQKKAFVAVTLFSKLREKIAWFESAYIDVSEVSIAELAIKKICALMSFKHQSPIILINLEGKNGQLLVFFNDNLYLVRPLQLPANLSIDDSEYHQRTLLEIQRSIDYCLLTLKLPEPQAIVLSPGFEVAKSLVTYLQQEQSKPLQLLDLNTLFSITPVMSAQEQQNMLYSVGGALSETDISATSNQAEESTKL
jgi:MSHA biogenesis protein MshI